MSLLRPPSHRGPLLAAGAAVLTVGVVMQQFRVSDLAPPTQALICLGPAALLLWLSIGAPLEGGRPPAYQSALIVCGLINLAPGLAELADALGAGDEGFAPGTGTWISAVLALVAGGLAIRRNSGIAALSCAVACGSALLFALDWVTDGEVTTHRWVLLALAVGCVLLSLVLRGSRPRQSEQLVSAAGLAVLTIPLIDLLAFSFGFFGDFATFPLPGFWEVVLLATGFGLVAYAAADRTPGPAYLGAANLAAFVVVDATDAERTLEWWPLTLLAAGGLMLLAGLRPARPLPPEPEGYRRDELPLSSRVEGGEQVYTVKE